MRTLHQLLCFAGALAPALLSAQRMNDSLAIEHMRADLRFLAISTLGEADIVEYPDTGKIAAAAGIRNADFRTATFKALGRVQPAEYWDGER